MILLYSCFLFSATYSLIIFLLSFFLQLFLCLSSLFLTHFPFFFYFFIHIFEVFFYSYSHFRRTYSLTLFFSCFPIHCSCFHIFHLFTFVFFCAILLILFFCLFFYTSYSFLPCIFFLGAYTRVFILTRVFSCFLSPL